MKKNRKMISAYMTVEVSLLFPIIIMLLLCLFYLVFYSYNRTVAHQNASIATLYGKSYEYAAESNRELTDIVYGVLTRVNEDQYLAVHKFKQSVKMEQEKIIITQKGTVSIPLVGTDIFSNLDFSEKITLKVSNPIFSIRQIRKVKKNINGNGE